MDRTIEDITLTVGDITPPEELWCVIPQGKGRVQERVARHPRHDDAIRVEIYTESTEEEVTVTRRERDPTG